jgi:3-oxoacyl-[acyl-carrier protein] reductase
MKERGWGRVINIGSFLGPMPEPFIAVYAATKMANTNQSVSLARALGVTGVTSNTVSPGPVRTPGMEAGAGRWSRRKVRFPAGRIGSPADIADEVAFPASTRARFITGANICVDGGMMPTVN